MREVGESCIIFFCMKDNEGHTYSERDGKGIRHDGLQNQK